MSALITKLTHEFAAIKYTYKEALTQKPKLSDIVANGSDTWKKGNTLQYKKYQQL
jgi:hypothetical protein